MPAHAGRETGKHPTHPANAQKLPHQLTLPQVVFNPWRILQKYLFYIVFGFPDPGKCGAALTTRLLLLVALFASLLRPLTKNTLGLGRLLQARHEVLHVIKAVVHDFLRRVKQTWIYGFPHPFIYPSIYPFIYIELAFIYWFPES